jgi:hypothetical protein
MESCHESNAEVSMEELLSGEVVEEVDIEEFAKAGRQIPRARRYRIRIDKQQYVVEVSHMTGREILALAGKTPEGYLLSQKLHGGQAKKIDADETVDFTAPGVERFMTLPRDATEG